MYSPPPMDGFSPPPMSDFSPPPLSDLSPLREFPPPINGFSQNEEDLEDLKDMDYDFSISDTQYDLTGLSDKLNSIQLEKINQLPPREIVELKSNSVTSAPFVNNFQVVLEVDNKVNETPTTTEPLEVNKNDINQNVPSQDVYQNVSNENIVNDSLDPMGMLSPLPEPPDKNLENSNTNSISIDIKSGDSDASECDKSELMTTYPNSEEGETDANISKNVIEAHADSSDDNSIPNVADDGDLPDPPHDVQEKINDTPNVKEVVSEDGNWGNFGENCFPVNNEDESWGYFGSESAPVDVDSGSAWCKAETVVETKVENSGASDAIEFDDSDDEFGDFGEADTVKNVSVAPELCTQENEPSLKLHLQTLSDESSDLIKKLFSSEQSPDEDEEPSVLLDQIVLKEGEIFEKIGNPESCLALDHQWKESAAYNIIMSTLGIDSRILLDGESWRSSVPKYPKNAASLMTPGLLTPEPVTNETTNNESASTDQVSPAQFDWSNSGLTNPLDENDQKQSSLPPETNINASNVKSSINNASSCVSVDASNSSNAGAKILKDHMSRETQNILDGLPLLNFMSSTFLKRPNKQS